ncbi:hypothetical protein WR25_24184 [Diploscapter pachys]|uniref:Major facilitator superfamily (MFS) profile domain-containing protein n=1 Tax=Diploscapter pachys TaxID=2018661 RepID=A0A2A2KZ48_9BILA|nr:hypothetical protein WR25_24184 [Diploscapter pachys]
MTGSALIVEVKHPLFSIASRRLHVIMLLLAATFVMNLSSSTIGLSLSCMVNSTAVASLPKYQKTREHLVELLETDNSTEHAAKCRGSAGAVVKDYGGTFLWDIETQGHIVAVGFFGSLLSSYPGGILVERYSIRHILLIACLLVCIPSILIPTAAFTFGHTSVIALRFGLMTPGFNAMLTNWVPHHEKSSAAALYTSGNQISAIIGLPMSSGLCASSFGWPTIFYMIGVFGFIWMVVWVLAVNNTPLKSRWMTQEELDYLNAHINHEKKTKHHQTPWSDILRSKVFYVLAYCSIMGSMMLALTFVYIPVYFKDVMMLDVKENGLLAAIPHFFNAATKFFWGVFMDYLRQKKILTATQACKLSQGLSMLLICVSFLLLCFVDCDTPVWIAISLFTLLCFSFGLSVSGFYTSLLSVSPNNIGILSSICFVLGYLGRIATPQLISYFKTIGTAEEWRGVLLVYAALSFISSVIFTLWGSGDVQPWDKPVYKKNYELKLITDNEKQ